ncbi:hypothetical protein HTZ77_11405 [Nonomuraea sp. SMC257]|uniref:Uncharacterized protein n=1 Tax=Nonomuraea montanisoli TaxID=2741721 RepID=A0A7Y6I5D9_9ACTN|nr:hypothetical protein [Nonomuraea montanisoli]NUW32032.1 hypothetical protein [Nonomuraea montanisoli]
MTEITPARLRDLAGRAQALAAEVRALAGSPALDSLEREHLRAALHAADWLDRGGEDLRRAAGDLARLRSVPEPACGVPWGVCPEHGNTLSSSGGVTTCRVCRRRWDHDRLGRPCQEPVTWKVTDRAGTVTKLCDGHVLAARAAVEGATFTRLDTTRGDQP